jgi:hypothetical protein
MRLDCTLGSPAEAMGPATPSLAIDRRGWEVSIQGLTICPLSCTITNKGLL